jgi:hypothetical protein
MSRAFNIARTATAIVALAFAPASAVAQPTTPKALAQLKQQCTAKGGRISTSGLRALPHCVVPTKDANRPCSDSSQCEAGCFALQPSPTDGSPLGHCKPDDEPFGCRAEVVNGRVQPTLCID